MNFKEIKRFFEPIKEQKLLTALFIIFVFYIAFFFIYSVEIIKKITDAIETKEIEKVYYLLYFFIVFILFYYLIRWYWKLIYPYYQANSKNYIQKKYIEKFILFDNLSYEKIWTGKLIAIIDKWIDTWRFLLADFFYFWVRVFFSFIFSLIYIYIIVWIKTFFVFILVIFLLFITKIINNKALEERSIFLDYVNLYTKDLVKVIMSKFEILQNDKIDAEINNLRKISDKEFLYFKRRNYWVELSFIVNRFFINVLKVLAIFIVWIWVIKWVYNFWDFLAIITVLTILDSNISDAVDLYKNFTKEYVKIEKFFELFDQTEKIVWYDTWKIFKYLKWNIKIKNLSFKYDEKIIFDNFDLEINGWKKTAIIWKSWSWKTTLIKLITWFLRANSWNIFIDNQDLSQISLKTYYKHIWYLTQDPSIFDWTIFENLTYWANKKITKNEIKSALDKAQANFVYDFCLWLETEIWERWIRLSGWQRQRLAIAKIFLKNPEIIILDEPTSALDSFSEESVTKAIENLFKDRTVIIIAHRLQTVKKADEIILIDDFKVKERWTHMELLKTWKYYKKMVDLQSWIILE